MRRISKTVAISDDLARLFDEARRLKPAQAEVSSNVNYMRGLEMGRSDQAPRGMIRAYRGEYRRMLRDSAGRNLRIQPGGLQRALNLTVADAAMEIMAAVAERTPVDTGRAKGSWVATLPGGKRIESGPTISAEQQRAIRRGRKQ